MIYPVGMDIDVEAKGTDGRTRLHPWRFTGEPIPDELTQDILAQAVGIGGTGSDIEQSLSNALLEITDRRYRVTCGPPFDGRTTCRIEADLGRCMTTVA